MIVHILPGDAQADAFQGTGLEGEVIVCREALIDGPVAAPDLEAFWRLRADFIDKEYKAEGTDYAKSVRSEFEKLAALPTGSEVNLWFEYELFCQVNMWFCLSLVSDRGLTAYRVAPVLRDESDIWKGFGGMDADDLRKCFSERVRLTAADLDLGASLWKAYSHDEKTELESLGHSESDGFPYLAEVCRAALEMGSRPKEILREILEAGITEFKDIFTAFSKRAGVYGFGDLQVKALLEKL